MDSQTILWRRLDRFGCESARLFFEDRLWRLAGTAVFAHDRLPCRLDYLIVCDAAWETVSGRVSGWVGAETVAIDLAVDSARRWRVGGVPCPEAEGSIDLDLNFSPSTNVLPIRRLRLADGDQAIVKAAWLRFPSFALEPLEQVYRRIDASHYRYESAGGKFVAELEVNAAGLVTSYPGFCEVAT